MLYGGLVQKEPRRGIDVPLGWSDNEVVDEDGPVLEI